MPKEKTWPEKCAESNGTMVMCPKDIEQEADEMLRRTDDYMVLVREFNKATAVYDNFAKNFWFRVRESLETLGHEDIFSKNVGWNEQAKREKMKIFNLRDSE